jgi:hypothetical protein
MLFEAGIGKGVIMRNFCLETGLLLQTLKEVFPHMNGCHPDYNEILRGFGIFTG